MSSVRAWALAAALGGLYLLTDPPSADLAAQTYRVGLFERAGYAIWDDGWYSGHHLPGYSLLFGPLGALLGTRVAGALAAIGAAWAFERVAARHFAPAAARWGALWFAAGTATLLLTGRLTFALGVALGVGAVWAAGAARNGVAAALAALCAAASPVAGVFLALAMAAWWLTLDPPILAANRSRRTRPSADRRLPKEATLWVRRRSTPDRARDSDSSTMIGGSRVTRRRWAPVLVAAAALAPVAALAIAFPEGGTFPFTPSAFWPTLAATVAVALALGPARPALRAGTCLYAALLVLSFAAPTPMGGNAVRLGALLAGPLLACALLGARTRLLLVLAPALVYWQWSSPVDDVRRASADASVHAGYYTGLLRFLRAQPGDPFRIEVPFTDNHWESARIAPTVPLARGWERQLDRKVNALFYDARGPTPARYERWLHANAVRFVALADAPVDYSAAAEAQLVRDGQPYLREVWRDAHWRVFAVREPAPLARGGRLSALEPDAFTVTGRGTAIDVRIRFTPYWQIVRGHGCVARTADGYTRVSPAAPGPVRVAARFALGRIRATSPRCTS